VLCTVSRVVDHQPSRGRKRQGKARAALARKSKGGAMDDDEKLLRALRGLCKRWPPRAFGKGACCREHKGSRATSCCIKQFVLRGDARICQICLLKRIRGIPCSILLHIGSPRRCEEGQGPRIMEHPIPTDMRGKFRAAGRDWARPGSCKNRCRNNGS